MFRSVHTPAVFSRGVSYHTPRPTFPTFQGGDVDVFLFVLQEVCPFVSNQVAQLQRKRVLIARRFSKTSGLVFFGGLDPSLVSLEVGLVMGPYKWAENNWVSLGLYTYRGPKTPLITGRGQP